MDEEYPIQLPRPRWSLLSHRDNVAYGIEMLQERPGHVIGYERLRSVAVREHDHHVLPLAVAEKRSKGQENYRFATLEILLEEQE